MATASLVFFVSTFVFISVFLRVRFEQFLSFKCTLDVHCGNRVFLCQAVCQNRRLTAVKEIQNPVLHMALFGAQFINSIPQIIGCRSSEFVSQLSQKLDAHSAVCPCPLIALSQVLQPCENWNLAIGFL